MASKRTWDDVLRDRGFDPEKRKKQQAAKYADESYKSRQETTISQIEQSEAVRKKQALQSIAESDAKKALDTLNLLTMGNADKVLASKRITFNAPYVEPIETVQPPIEQEEKKPWYKITGWDLLKGLFKGQKQKKDMTLEERLAADAEYRKMIGGQPAAYLGSKAEEGLMRFHQGLWNAAATLAENIAPESKVTKDLKKTQAGFENWININQELNQPASEGQKILGDVISSTTQMMPSLIIRTFSPIAGDLAFGIPVVGTSAREAELEGANPAQQLAYGLTSGAAETAIERIAFFKPLEKLMPKGVFSDVVKAGTANMKKSLLGIGWDTLKAMGGEAFEEAIADPISGLAKKVIYDHDKPWLGKNGVVDLKAMAYDALIGGITGGVFSLPTMPFNVSDALAVKKYIDENYDATLILAQGLPEEYASHKKAVEYTKNVYPISYNELVDLQNQVTTDLKDYAQKVSKKEAVTSEPVAPAESKQTEPEKPKPAPEPRTIEQKIESLKNARAKLKEGTPGYEAISRQIAELEKEQKKTDVPAAEAAPETVPADKGNVITPETEITAPAAPERQKPSYKVGDAVAIKSGDTTRTITITEIGTSTVKGVTDNGTPIQYGKKAFENSIVDVTEKTAQTKAEVETTAAELSREDVAKNWVKDDSKTYRYAKDQNPMSDWGHAMFADDPTRYGDPYDGIIHDYLYSVKKSDLVDISDLRDDIIKQWNEDIESAAAYNYTFSNNELKLSGEEVADGFDPIDIVDSAAAYDNHEFTQWLWDRVLEPKGITGVKTKNGAVVFDESIIQKDYDSIAKQHGATNAETEAKPKGKLNSKSQAISIDTSKYGRSGKAAFEKWSQNEYINADISNPDSEYTQKWMQLFDKYYNLGRENKPMPRFDEKGELEAEFPPFILDEIYRAGKVDYEAQQKHEAKKAWQREEAGEDNKKTEGSFEATMYHGKGKSASEIYTNTQYPVLGEGSYYAFSKKIAANYGKDVTESKVSLKNPYIIRDDVDWKELVVGKVGWKYPNNTFADSEQVIKEIKALKDYLLENGYDGIIVKYEEDREGDINVKTGNPIKTVNKMLGHDQVVVYDVTVETAKTEEKPVETKQEKGGIIEKKEGKSDGENAISSDENRADIPQTPENIPPADAQKSDGQRGTGETRLSDTRGPEGGNGKSDTGRVDTGSGLGDSSAKNSDTGRTRAGEQHTGNRSEHVRLNQHSNPKGTDYVINSQEDSIVEKNKKVRYQNNVAAIKLIKQIESEGRLATPEEQKILAKYVGWGGIPEAFSSKAIRNYETNQYEKKAEYKDWESEYNELKELLTEEEYKQAHETILNAHYTSIDVIKSMYEGLKHLGFDGGRVLEPAVGIGNFIGAMPADLRSNVKVMTGIEIDSITGRIAKLLYPNADIRVQGFEKAKLPTGYYDVAISNVPFGQIQINDPKYSKSLTKSIHNYFFAKALDVVRPGGIVMFITSSKTMDSKDTSGIRAYIKSKADVIGAIRLPNTAFKENAMTEVTTDIIVLKVREKGTEYSGEAFLEMGKVEVNADWGKSSEDINEYFINHPENVLGELRYGRSVGGYYGVYVKGDGRDIGKAVIEAMKRMPADIYAPAKSTAEGKATGSKIVRESSKGTKEGSYEVVDGKLTINRDGKLVEVDKAVGEKEIKTISKMIEIKNKARELLNAQRNNAAESEIVKLRKELNKLYDSFVKDYGYLNNAKNVRLIADDPDISFLLSLENYTKPKRGNKNTGEPAVKESATKGDIFSKNTVAPIKKIDRTKSAKEALIVSLNEKGMVDINRISELTGKDESEVVKELAGYIYKNPVTSRYETADEYLSGNVKAKLREAEAYAINEPEYKANVEALKKVQPPDKEAWQISLKLGSSLISEEIYQEFAKHLFGSRAGIEIRQMKQTGVWSVNESKDVHRYYSVKKSALNTATWGLDKRGFTGLELLEKIMNNSSIVVNDTYTDEYGKKIKVNNPEATALAQERAEKIKEEFIKWLSEHDGGNTIAKVVQQYNDVYNTDVLREFDGSHLPDTFERMNPEIKLASHQKDAVWRIISSRGSTLLAHEVGAGKTFEMIAAAMEMKRLGTIKKPMFCVPNNVYEQWGIEFRRLYPDAKILIPTKEELERKNRRVFMNRIATGSYDAVIIPESQFSMLPMSIEAVTDFYNEKIMEMETAIEIEIAENGKGTNTEKKITKALKNLRTKMEKKIDKMKKDRDNIDFEELGIDFLFVDEAHRFKNLMYTTRLSVSGLGNPSGSDKAFDLLMKTRYLQKLNDGRGVVFATATPLLNSIAEIYNWQQYLCPEQLHSRGIYSFDAWASIFAKMENVAEVKPEGSGYRVKNGISKITNVGQLAKMFREFTDFKTQEMLNLPRPDVKGGKYEVISIPGTKWLKEYMKSLSDRAEAVRHGQVDPTEDNLLKITTDGRKAALYPGLVDPSFQAEEGEMTKVDVAVEHVYKQWEKTKKDRLTHLVFLEFSTPKPEKEVADNRADAQEDADTYTVDSELDSVYQEFKRRLVAKGIPEKEIAFIHDAKNSDQKIALKNRFNAGEIRILIGNNEKMGVGIDLQKRTKTITHIDFPWRPKDLQQEDGRGLRQGNINKEIEMYVLVTEGSFDARLWDNLQRKSKLVDDMLTSDLDAVEIEDVGVQTLSAQEVVGIASGNPLMQEQIIVSQKVIKLRALEKGYMRDKRENQKKLIETEAAVNGMKESLSNLKKMSKDMIDTSGDNFKIIIEGKTFTERNEAEDYLEQIRTANKEVIKKEGIYEFSVDFAGVINRAKYIYSRLGNIDSIDLRFYADKYDYTKSGSLKGLEASLRNIQHNIESIEQSIEISEKNIAQLRQEVKKEFPHTEELRKLVLREQELMRILNPEQVLNVGVEAEEDADDSDDVQAFTGTAAEMPRGDDSSKTSKTVDDLIKIVEKHTGVPIRTGKYRQKAHGVFKVQPEVIRTKVRGDVPTISHELGHYFDKKHKFSANNEFKDELLKLGAPVSKSSYSPKDIRSEGVAEFMRLYLTNPILADDKAPLFMAHFEKSIDADTLKFLSMLRREISAIRNLPNNKKIWNDISSGESRRSNTESARLVDRFYDAWIDEDGPFARLQSYVDAKGWEGENLDIMVKLYKGMASKVKSNLYYDQRDLDGNVVGDSLMKILEPLSPKEVKKRTGKRGNSVQEKKDFITYMVSRRAMDYKDRGLAMPQPWYVYEDNIISMEGKYPHFVDVFEGLIKWEDNNLQLLVDAGIKTQNDIETIKFMNTNHVPLYRIRDAAESMRPGSGSGLGQSREVIKRVKGSGATIIDPLESMINDAFIIRRAAEANKIYNVLYKMSKLEGVGKMIEVIPPGGRTTLFTVEEIRGQMLKSADAEIKAIKEMESSEDQKKALKQAEAYKEAIENMSDEQLESVMSIYRPLYQEKDNQVVAYVDGKKVLMEVDPHLFKAIKGLNPGQAHILLRLLGKVKNVRVATIVTDMVFVLRNVARDFGTSLVQSEAGIKPWDIIRGYISVAAKDKWYKEYLATGGAIDFSNVYTRRQAQKLEDEVLQYTLPEKAAVFIEALGELRKNNNARTRDKLKNATKDLISMPIDMIRDAVEWSEAGARVAEFRKAVEKLGADKDTAASWSRKLSVDFLRHGYAAKQVNQGIAFFNPNLQGIARILETFKTHPARTFVRGFAYITLPTMLLYMFNHDDDDYMNLPEYRRALFYNIPLGDGKFITIPKPPGWGWIFGALPEFAMNKILKDDPEAWEEIMSTFKQSFSLPTEVTAIGPIIDVATNKTWTGAPIEGKYERDNKPAYLIRDEKTSLLANLIGDTAKNYEGLSPKQIDYLIKQYIGNLGTSLWQMPDTIKSVKETPDDVTQYPIIKSFITDAAYSSESVNDLYDIGEELDLRRKELMETGEYPAMSHLPLERQKELFVALEGARAEYNQLTEEFENARKAIKEIREDDKYTPAQKKFKERAIKVKMNKIAAEFNEKYRKFKQKHDIK